jgi:putative toxin-antitoxin system antitoxin component (TIGR02293 family)
MATKTQSRKNRADPAAALDSALASAPIDVLERAMRIMGGVAAVGRAIDNEVDLLEAVRRGLPAAVLGALERAGMTREEVERLVVRSSPDGRQGYDRRRELTPEESDRVVRCARVLACAEDVFGSAERARDWLRRPKPVLNGRAPMDVLDSEVGARVVEDLLQGVAHGIAA